MTKTETATIVAAVLAALEAKGQTKPVARKTRKVAKPAASKDERQAAFAKAVIEVFAKEGKTVEPNKDVFTYRRWTELGFKPVGPSIRVKTKGMRGKGIPMWSKDMVEQIAA